MSVRRESGLTLVELLITLSVLAILTTLVGPAFSETIKENRMAAQANNFLGDLLLARSEAGKRNGNIRVCASSDNVSCDLSLGKRWESGWIVWQDADGDSTVDPVEIIRANAGSEGTNSVLGLGNIDNLIEFDAQGKIAGVGSFTFCDSRGATHAKSIVIGPSGRARIVTHDYQGEDLTC
jgi:type IV fimbrial biogenesis protein FimT